MLSRRGTRAVLSGLRDFEPRPLNLTPWSWLAIVLGLLLLAPIVLADSAPPREIDPADEPAGNGATDYWSLVSIPQLAPGSTLGHAWVGAGDLLYVWGTQSIGVPGVTSLRRSDGGDDQGGGTNPPDPVLSSTLYRFDGNTWTVAFNVTDERAGEVFGTGPTDIYAATTALDGTPRLYRFDGSTWYREILPTAGTGPAGAIVGAPGDVLFRAGGTIFRYDGARWAVIHQMTMGHPSEGLVYVGPDEIYMQGCSGHCVFDGHQWRNIQGPEFLNVMNAWGARSADGALTLFAIGCNGQDGGMRVWGFYEAMPGCLWGTWDPVGDASLAVPGGMGRPGAGHGSEVWGARGGDVYAVGTLFGNGVIYRFDGRNWESVEPFKDLPPATGVTGSRANNVWVTLANGNLLHYNAPNRAPDVAAAIPSRSELWPPHMGLLPLGINGVVDRDGDPVTIRVLGVTSDEPVDLADPPEPGTQWPPQLPDPPDPGAVASACPDAGIAGDGSVSLRAERLTSGNGRVYAVTYEASDGRGGNTVGTVKVGVPLRPGVPVTDDGQRFDATLACAMASEAVFVRKGDPRLIPERGVWRIEFALERPAKAQVRVFDVAGRRLATLLDGTVPAGAHTTRWILGSTRAGIYFVNVRVGDRSFTRRVFIKS